MSSITFLARLKRIGWSDRLLLAEALAILAAASLAIRLAPFRHVVGAASRAGRRAEAGRASGDQMVRRVRWAVSAWADRVPWRAVCFQRGLAVHFMLRRRGLPSILHYGVSQKGPRGLHSHVWITQNGDYVVGGEEAGDFTLLASFPSEPSFEP